MIRAHHLDHRDAGFATELTYGTLRSQAPTTPFWRIARIVRWRKIGTTTLIVLRMGVHQLLSMRVPAHAALNQSVALARAQIGGGPANFVNAVLRRVSERSREDWYARLEADAKDDTENLRSQNRIQPGLCVPCVKRLQLMAGLRPKSRSFLMPITRHLW